MIRNQEMLPPGLQSAQEVLLYYDRVYAELIQSGKHPFIYPWASVGAFLIILYLLIDHRGSHLRRAIKYLAWTLLTVYQTWCLLTNKARNPASGFGVGLVSSFGWLWVTSHMVLNDCQLDYKRIERGPDGKLYWQRYPASIAARIDWIVDMFFSFRGVGWSWQTNGVPPAPSWVEKSLKGENIRETTEPGTVSKTGIRRLSDLRELLADTVPAALLGYIALDALKTTIIHDPYFWGYTDAPAPAMYPPAVRQSPILTKCCRLLLTLTFVVTALRTIYKLGPILFAGILGPRWIGLRGEPWMNPADYFGSFSNIVDKGLAGLWGGFWHQTFRYSFEVPGTKLLAALGVDKKSQTGKTIALFTAFFASGCLHACGSYTQLGDTRPLRGPMAFFLSQAVGITIESAVSDTLKAQSITLPQAVQRTINVIFATIWLYFTAPLLANDFAQGGVWLFEPVPISIFRGLGLGPAGTGWWAWGNGIAWWRNGHSWYDTGIAL